MSSIIYVGMGCQGGGFVDNPAMKLSSLRFSLALPQTQGFLSGRKAGLYAIDCRCLPISSQVISTIASNI